MTSQNSELFLSAPKLATLPPNRPLIYLSSIHQHSHLLSHNVHLHLSIILPSKELPNRRPSLDNCKKILQKAQTLHPPFDYQHTKQQHNIIDSRRRRNPNIMVSHPYHDPRLGRRESPSIHTPPAQRRIPQEETLRLANSPFLDIRKCRRKHRSRSADISSDG